MGGGVESYWGFLVATETRESARDRMPERRPMGWQSFCWQAMKQEFAALPAHHIAFALAPADRSLVDFHQSVAALHG